MGSVTSMWRGRVRVIVSRNLIFSEADGPGGMGMESRLARRRRMVFLYVSFVKMVRIMEKIAKKIRVHCVHRQFLRTVTKEPMTGLRIVRRLLFVWRSTCLTRMLVRERA